METLIDNWNTHQVALKRYILSRVKDPDTTNDILQETFIKFHSYSPGINSANVKPWLFKVATNLLTDHYRALTRDKNKTAALPENDSDANPINERFSQCLLSFIDKLPFKYKQAIQHSHLQNGRQVQLSKSLNISYSGAKSRVQRARKMLKEMFLECCNVSTDRYGNILEDKIKTTCKTCMV